MRVNRTLRRELLYQDLLSAEGWIRAALAEVRGEIQPDIPYTLPGGLDLARRAIERAIEQAPDKRSDL